MGPIYKDNQRTQTAMVNLSSHPKYVALVCEGEVALKYK